MSLYNVLPPPRHTYTTITTSNNPYQPQINPAQIQIATLNASIPPYGKRQGYVPREPEDYGDGGAFPEIHIKQYPLDMGRKDLQKSTSGVVALRVNAEGEIEYDSILRENMRKEQIMHSKYSDLAPKDDIATDEFIKPCTEDIEIETEETRKSLEKLINKQIQSARPTHTNLNQSKPQFIRYQSGTQSGGVYNNGAK
eukprot:355110_1